MVQLLSAIRSQYILATSKCFRFGLAFHKIWSSDRVLFLLYTANLLQLIERSKLIPLAYVDDTQVYGFCRLSEVDDLRDRMSACIDDVSSWMKAKSTSAQPCEY
jgi:hypothetical protein